MTAPRKPRAPRREQAPVAPPLPAPDGAVELHRLSRDQLSVFLYLALLPEESARLAKDWKLSQPGFRTGALGEVQRCDLIADEIRALPERGEAVLGLLRKAFGALPLAGWRIDGPGAEELGGLVQGDAALAMVLWRLLADPSPEVQAVVRPWLDDLARRHYGPAEGEGTGAEAAVPEGGRGAAAGGAEEQLRKLSAQLEAARREAAAGNERAEALRRKEEEARERLQAQLKEARAREAQAAGEAARAREAADAARREQARAEAALAAVRGEDLFAEAQRARSQARDLEGRTAALEGRLARGREREEELERELAAARAAAPAAAPAPAGPESEPAGDEAEAQASWLFPIYTKEFYDSLEGWDRRIQRAAFKQAHLLATDHRHPSLRALPLEGLPGYYRVRVATDVRLLYRRGERQNAVEILSLIDREDLDRYVRQAKTR